MISIQRKFLHCCNYVHVLGLLDLHTMRSTPSDIILQLRDNAQKELKQIRDEVIDKKINATLVKKSLSLLETRSPNDV